MDPEPEASVIVATRDRRDDLARSLRALGAQRTTRAFEVIVVDDGSVPPLPGDDVGAARLLRAPGDGPGRARNLGADAARAPVLLFTDDDTEVDPGWVDAALAFLDAHSDHVGVHGPIDSPPWDPLVAYSVKTSDPGGYYTANMGFRTQAFLDIGGFAKDMPYPHAEDLDLAFRVLDRGRIGWAPGMQVLHHPRLLTWRQFARRGRYAASEVVLFRRHPARFSRPLRRLPAYAVPYVNMALIWGGLFRRELLRRRPRPVRAARVVALALGQAFEATAAFLSGAAARQR